MNQKILLLGCGGHGKVVADIAEKNGYTYVAFLDDMTDEKERGGYPILGKSCEAERFEGYDFLVTIGNAAVRAKKQAILKEKNLPLATLIHPNAIIGKNVHIGEGSVVMAGAVVNPGAILGDGVIVNTCASVDHDCMVDDFAHVSVGARVAGTVTVGKRTWIGAGAVVSNNLTVCDDCMIGAGAVVVKSITESGTWVGVPAKKIK